MSSDSADITTTPTPDMQIQETTETAIDSTTMGTIKEVIETVCTTDSTHQQPTEPVESKAEIAIALMNMLPPPPTVPEPPTTNTTTSGNSLLDKMEQLYTYVKTTLGNQKISAASIMTIANNLMQIIEKYGDLTGNQKKMLVIDTIKRVINETIDDDSDRSNLLMIADLTLPTVIDTLVSAINGDLKFDAKKVQGLFQKLFGCCCK